MFSSKSDTEILYQALDLYTKECVEALPDDTEAEAYTFSKNFEIKMQKLINFRKKPYYKYLNTVAKRVASVVLITLVCLFVAVFSVKALREPFIDFIVETYEKFTSLLTEKELPDENFEFTIKKPQYIPEGYVAQNITKDGKMYMCTYNNSEKGYFVYLQNLAGNWKSVIDTENIIYEDITINSVGGIFYKNKDMNCIAFDDGIYTYNISGYISKEELIKIAESIKIN